MIPEQAWGLVPNEIPAELEEWVLSFADAAEFSERERRAYAWANYLLSRLDGRVVSTAVLGLLIPSGDFKAYEVVDISAGFIPYSGSSGELGNGIARQLRMSYNVPSVMTYEGSYAFGVVIGVQSAAPTSEENLGSGTELSQLVAIDNFPVVAEYRRLVESAPPNPMGVVSACYAKPRLSKRFFGPSWSNGIIIARHVLGNLGFSPGTLVPMRSGISIPVVDIDGATTIDAAILDCVASPTVSPLSLPAAVAPSTTVDIRTATGSFSAQVLRIYEDPHYYGNMMSHRAFIDKVGISGDSGSLVVRTSHLDAVGLYMGSTGGLPAEGIVQSMRQVVQYFDVDLFD
jgi:hypothetical protein